MVLFYALLLGIHVCGNGASLSNAASFKAQIATEAKSMSMSHAVSVLKHMNGTSHELIKLVQEDIVTRRKLKGSKRASEGTTQTATPDPNAQYSTGIKNAMVRLNEMMLEAILNMDEVDLECRQFSRKQQYYITELEQDSQYYSQQVTRHGAGVLDARQWKSTYGDKIPIVDAELKAHNLQCSQELADLHRQLRIAKGDQEVMDKILNMTKCNDAMYDAEEVRKIDPTGTNPSSVTMLQCRNWRTGRKYTKMQITDPALKRELAKLKHSKSVEMLKDAVADHKSHKAHALIQERQEQTALRKLSQRKEAKTSVKLDGSVARKGDNRRRRRAPPRRRRAPPPPPPEVFCTCTTPNAGSAGHNEYKCTDGETAHCQATQTCYAEGQFKKGDWSAGCTKYQCEDGKFGLNFCSDWCNTDAFWPACGINTLSKDDPRNTGTHDYICDCGDCNSCGQEKEEYGQEVQPAAEDPNLGGEAEQCSMENSSKCPELRERFVNIAGGVEDAIEELETMIANKQGRCQQIRADLEAEMEHYGYWYKVWETRLASAIASMGESRTQLNNKESELINARGLYNEKMTSCHTTITDSKTELCALTKIRGELALMNALKDIEYVDCQTSDWDIPTCGVTCGGGTQTLTRIVETQPGNGVEGPASPTTSWDRGHECPLLEATQTCNEFRCPVDCELKDWEEWSRCTVTCGGGIRERLRDIVVHPTPEGNPCEVTLESALCNAGPCDEDCELSEWTDWSTTCTKMCGNGQTTRVKTLVKAEKGAGTCPGFYDTSRFHAKLCNTQPCKTYTTVGRCFSRLDVILAIDGSGSLGYYGWKAMKETSVKLAKSMGLGASLGAILFSGPPNSCILKKCTGQALPWFCSMWYQPYQGREYTPEDCGVTWVTHLDQDLAAATTKIDNMVWPAQNTLTSKALKSAQIEMISSRQGVPTVVIVLTDGYPYSPLHTFQNAEALKASGARLMMVPVGAAVADSTMFDKLASWPSEDNVIRAESLEALTASNQTVNQILTGFCTNFVP